MRIDPMTHHLKCWPENFQDISTGVKTFEVRRADRDYQVGDTLILCEWEPGSQQFTGHRIPVRVSYLLTDPEFVKEGFVIMGIEPR